MSGSDTSLMPDVSRFGSPRGPVRAAGAVLRARAEASGVAVQWVSPVELASAVIGADAWSALTGSPTLDRPQRFGPDAVRSLSAVLSRASGRGSPPAEVSALDCPMAPHLLRLAEEHAVWADALVPGRSGEILDLAASDLSAAGSGTVFSAYASLLVVVAATSVPPL